MSRRTDNPMKRLLLTVAAIASIYATASYLTGFTADFTVSAVIAALALGGVFAIDHMDARQAWLARYREDVWHRRIEEMER